MWDYLKPPTQLQMERIELILERLNEVTTQLKLMERKIDNLLEVKENMRKASIAEILLVTENSLMILLFSMLLLLQRARDKEDEDKNEESNEKDPKASYNHEF